MADLFFIIIFQFRVYFTFFLSVTPMNFFTIKGLAIFNGMRFQK